MKKKFSVVIALGILLLVLIGCGNRPHVASEDNNLIIINNTSQKIYSFGLEQRHSSGGGQYADGSPVKRGESFGFYMDKYDGCEFILTAKDKKGDEIFRSQQLKENFSEGKVTVSINEDEDGDFYAEVER